MFINIKIKSHPCM